MISDKFLTNNIPSLPDTLRLVVAVLRPAWGDFYLRGDSVMNYKEKLNDPRWQRKRLEIMNEDDFTCQICENTKNTLMVHHIRYIPGLKPWEHPNSLLITLCEDCHDFVHEKGRWEWVRDYDRGKRLNTCIDG